MMIQIKHNSIVLMMASELAVFKMVGHNDINCGK